MESNVVHFQPRINARRAQSESVAVLKPAQSVLNRMRAARAVGVELVLSGGVTGFVPKGLEEVPEQALNLKDLGELHELIRTGQVMRRSVRGFAFARYELLS